ncbi:interleukin-18 isoform X1 [Callospermophilus lateralis]|uniref:interleukin-18 isoform X1 n=1 Tax=Callospermophilus lateralis TaxID=76772 RepID=UPI0040386978
MAATPTENNYINFVEMTFIDDTLYFKAEDDGNEPRTTFEIYIYKDSQPRGLAVAISVKCEKYYTLSCENKNISFKEIHPPDNINETKSDIIFFQRAVPGHDDKRQFESSLYEGYFLACKKEKDLYKLTLKKQDDSRDKSIMFTVLNKN